MLKTALDHTYTYHKFVQRHYIHSSPSRNPPNRFMFINSNYTSPYFLTFTYRIKSTILHGILRNYDPIRQMYIICPLINTFPPKDARPIIIPEEYTQPIEVALLENIHRTNINHKLYTLFQNTNHEFSATTEKLDIIRALEILWLAMLLVTPTP